MITTVYKYVLHTSSIRDYTGGWISSKSDLLIKRLFKLYTKHPQYVDVYGNHDITPTQWFLTWVVGLTPEQLEPEFNSHEVVELLLPCGRNVGNI